MSSPRSRSLPPAGTATPAASPPGAPPREKPRRRFCIVSPSRSLIYSLEFIGKVYCVPRTIHESAELVRTLGVQRALADCHALMIDLQGETGEANRAFLRDLVRDRRLDGIETFALTPTRLGLSYPGVTEVPLTASSFQLNVGAFDRIISRWKHPDARPQILPAYRALLQRGVKEVELQIEGRHHFWQKLAVLDSDPMFGEVLRHLCLRLGYTFTPYQSPRKLARDIASGVQFGHVIIDQAFGYQGSDEIDPSTLLGAAAEVRASAGFASGTTPAMAEVAQKVFTAPAVLAQRLARLNFHSVHDQMTRILPPVPQIGEIDRMYPSNPLLVNISDLARKLDPTVRIRARVSDPVDRPLAPIRPPTIDRASVPPPSTRRSA